jgi:hypothetical protein
LARRILLLAKTGRKELGCLSTITIPFGVANVIAVKLSVKHYSAAMYSYCIHVLIVFDLYAMYINVSIDVEHYTL